MSRVYIVCLSALVIALFAHQSKVKGDGDHVLILTSPVGSTSHSIFLNAIAIELAARGMKVSHRCIGEFERTEGVDNHVASGHHPDRFMYPLMFEESLFKRLRHITFTLFSDHLRDAIVKTYNEPFIRKLVDKPDESPYKVVLIDAFFGEIYLPLANHIRAPVIFVSSTLPLSHVSWSLGLPYHYFINFLGRPESTGLLTRTVSFVFHCYDMFFINHHVIPLVQQLTTTFIPDHPPLLDLAAEVSFMLTSNPPVIMDSVPTDPHVMDIGCVQCRPSKPICGELAEVLERSGDDGAVYFTFGSIVKAEWIPDRVILNIISALAQLPQTILWKGKRPKQLPDQNNNNSKFYFSDWFPQQDLLAHPMVRLVINNGGLNTIQEALYHGCPVLGLPLTGDHHYSMKAVQENGCGEALDWTTFTSDQLLSTINKIINGSSYKKCVVRASERLRDRLESPASQAAFWVQYVVRRRGAPFLKSPSQHLGWFQYFILDIICIFAITRVAFCVVCIQLLRLLYNKLTR